MTIKFQNRANFLKALRSTRPRLKEEMNKLTELSAQEMVAFASLLTMGDRGIIKSIKYEKNVPRKNAITISAGGELTTFRNKFGAYDYALAREYGTVIRPAQPFFFPAFRNLKKEYPRRGAAVMRRVFREAGF